MLAAIAFKWQPRDFAGHATCLNADGINKIKKKLARKQRLTSE